VNHRQISSYRTENYFERIIETTKKSKSIIGKIDLAFSGFADKNILKVLKFDAKTGKIF
jgi:hypothetical protein